MADDTDGINLDDVRVILDLPRLGELIAHVAAAFAQIREIDPPDFEGQEMRYLAVSGWKHVQFMSDRVQFAESVKTDLAMLDALGARPEPEHRPEFGGAAPIGWSPPV